MTVTCCVPGCYNNTKKNRDLSFHRFPEDSILKQQWIVAIGRCDKDSKYKLFSPTSSSHRICSAHWPQNKKTPGSIPSLFPLKSIKSSTRITQTAKRAATAVCDIETADELLSSCANSSNEHHTLCISAPIDLNEVAAHEEVAGINTDQEYEEIITSDHTYAKQCLVPHSPGKSLLNKRLATASSDMLSMMQSLSTAKTELRILRSRTLDIETVKPHSDLLNLYTGFKKTKHFTALVQFLKPDESILIFPHDRRCSLSMENCLLLTLTRYKLNSPQEDLAFR